MTLRNVPSQGSARRETTQPRGTKEAGNGRTKAGYHRQHIRCTPEQRERKKNRRTRYRHHGGWRAISWEGRRKRKEDISTGSCPSGLNVWTHAPPARTLRAYAHQWPLHRLTYAIGDAVGAAMGTGRRKKDARRGKNTAGRKERARRVGSDQGARLGDAQQQSG